MKTILLFLLVVGTAAVAQPVRLTYKDGKEVNTQISAISNSTLYTPAGNILIKDLSAVSFEGKSQQDQTTYDRLEAAGVTVSFTGAPIIPDAQVGPVQPHAQISQSEEALRASLRRYQDAHRLGTGLQLLGFGLTVAGSALYMSDPEGNKDIAQILTIGGGLSFVIGLGVELSAGGVKF